MAEERFVKVGAFGSSESAGYTVKGNKVWVKAQGWKDKADYREIYRDGYFGGLIEKKGLTQYVKNMRKMGYKVSIKKIK